MPVPDQKRALRRSVSENNERGRRSTDKAQARIFCQALVSHLLKLR